jgi:hypothetical protein
MVVLLDTMGFGIPEVGASPSGARNVRPRSAHFPGRIALTSRSISAHARGSSTCGARRRGLVTLFDAVFDVGEESAGGDRENLLGPVEIPAGKIGVNE